MSLKHDCNNLYFHPYNLDERQKLLFYFTSLSRRSPVNTSTPNFSNFNLKKTQLRFYLLFPVSLKYGCNNLCFHPFNIDNGQYLFSLLTSLSRRDLVNPSTSTFGNINLTESITNLIVAWKVSQKISARMQESLFVLYTL